MLAPLPAGAQFLNVIESVFSGMARAVIDNSNYGSVDEARAAIDRYIQGCLIERRTFGAESRLATGHLAAVVHRVSRLISRR
jgi:hypothetical protein